MVSHALIDQREYERTLKFIEEFRLAEHDPRIALQLRTLDASNPSPLDAEVWASLREAIKAFEQFHQDVPFITAPTTALLQDGIRIAHQHANNAPIVLDPSELARNLLVLGSSGSGKTSILLSLADQLLTADYDVWFFDVKSDAQRLAFRHDRMLALHPHAPIDLLAKPPYLSLPEHIALIGETFTRATYGGQAQRAVMHEVLTTIFAEHEHPTIHDAVALLEKLPRKGDTYDRLNAIRNCGLRLRRLLERYGGLASRDGIPAYELCERAVLFPFLAMSDLEEFLIAYFATHLFHHHRTQGIRDLRTVIIVEESLLLFRGEGGTSRISGNAVGDLVGLTREFGTAWAISASAAHLLDPTILNVFCVIALNATSSNEAAFVGRLTGLTKEQLDHYRFRLTRGQAIVRLGDRYRHPMLATFEPWPHQKTVTSAEWQTVLERINALGKMRAGEGVTMQPTLSASPRLLLTARQDLSPNKIALNTNEQKLLRFIGEHRVVLTTECDLHPQLLIRAKRKLLTLGLINEEKITARQGRGGQANALGLTRTGFEWLRLTPGGAGGGKFQHQYLVRKLIERIPGAAREVSLNGKRVDVFFTYNSEHAWISNTLGIALNAGDHVAIEVEVSDPAKTAPTNMTKNVLAGVTCTVIAVFPSAVARMRAALAGATVVNVFDLLEERV